MHVRTLLSGIYPEGRLARFAPPSPLSVSTARRAHAGPRRFARNLWGRRWWPSVGLSSETGLGLFHPTPLPFRLG